jgi:DNA-binding response OmpR family regulator
MTKGLKSDVLQGCRILIVEDEPILAMSLQDRLESKGGHIIALAPREAKAFEVLATDRPDIVVLDLNLGGKLPTDLAVELVAQQIPFVIVTGYGKRHFDSPALQEAPRLQKPVNMKELILTMASLLRTAD